MRQFVVVFTRFGALMSYLFAVTLEISVATTSPRGNELLTAVQPIFKVMNDGVVRIFGNQRVIYLEAAFW
jgi:hypothetical protein